MYTIFHNFLNNPGADDFFFENHYWKKRILNLKKVHMNHLLDPPPPCRLTWTIWNPPPPYSKNGWRHLWMAPK